MRQAHEGQHPLSLPLSYTIMAVWACHCHSPLHLSGNMTIPIREAETARYATQVGTLSAYCQYTVCTKSGTRSANIRHKSQQTISKQSAQNPANCQQTFSTKVGIQSANGTPCGSKHIPTEAQMQIEGSILLPVTGWEMEPQNIQLKT